MQFATYKHAGQYGYGLVRDNGIVELSSQTSHPSLRALIASGQLAEIGRQHASASPDFGLDAVEFLRPIREPAHIFCIGLNYAEHAAEGGNRVAENPAVFVRFPESLVGHDRGMVKPKESDKFDYECELCVVIGKKARRVPAAQALDYVAGYTVFNDGSVRDWQRHTQQYTAGKNFEHSGAVGPWMVTADEIPDPQALNLTTKLNGSLLQNGNTKDMIFGVREIIAYISTFTTLEPGDLIATGTPSGVGFARKPPIWMKPGDVIECAVERIGTLRNTIVEG